MARPDALAGQARGAAYAENSIRSLTRHYQFIQFRSLYTECIQAKELPGAAELEQPIANTRGETKSS